MRDFPLTRSRAHRIAGVAFLVIGIGLVGAAVYTGYVQVYEINSAVETTQGTILNSTVDSSTFVEDDETKIRYYPRATYEYTVDGESYTGDRIYSRADRTADGREFELREPAEAVTDEYPPGTEVTVYYYPGNPARSFLVKPSVNWKGIGVLAVFGLVFVLGSVAFFHERTSFWYSFESPHLYLVGGIVFVAIGLGIIGIGLNQAFFQVLDVNSAVATTQGTVQSSNVTTTEVVDDGETTVKYVPRVTYEYTVDGQTYLGDLVYSRVDRSTERGVPRRFDSRTGARSVANRYRPGSEVTVHYYPEDPERSFLVRPTIDTFGIGVMVTFGSIFLLLGAVFAYYRGPVNVSFSWSWPRN